jgi:hypothetical protein
MGHPLLFFPLRPLFLVVSFFWAMALIAIAACSHFVNYIMNYKKLPEEKKVGPAGPATTKDLPPKFSSSPIPTKSTGLIAGIASDTGAGEKEKQAVVLDVGVAKKE